MPLYCGGCRGSRESLHIGLHHIRYPAYLGGLPQVVHRRLAVSHALAESFQCDIETDLVPVFEAIRNGLRNRENTRGYAFDVMYFLTELKGWLGETHDTHSRVIRTRPAILLANSHPDLERVLRANVMEPQRRQEADHAPWCAFCGLGESVEFRNRSVDCGIEPTSRPDDGPALLCKPEILPGDSVGVEIARAKYTSRLDEFSDFGNRFSDGHTLILQYVGGYEKDPTKEREREVLRFLPLQS